jgi:hypothetical protein
MLNSWREVPAAPRHIPHFHLNILPDARSVRNTRAMIRTFLDFLRAHGHGQVYGQMATYGSRRNEGLFNRYGFRVMDRVEVTKYRGLYHSRVLLCTVLKDLRTVSSTGREHRM